MKLTLLLLISIALYSAQTIDKCQYIEEINGNNPIGPEDITLINNNLIFVSSYYKFSQTPYSPSDSSTNGKISLYFIEEQELVQQDVDIPFEFRPYGMIYDGTYVYVTNRASDDNDKQSIDLFQISNATNKNTVSVSFVRQLKYDLNHGYLGSVNIVGEGKIIAAQVAGDDTNDGDLCSMYSCVYDANSTEDVVDLTCTLIPNTTNGNITGSQYDQNDVVAAAHFNDGVVVFYRLNDDKTGLTQIQSLQVITNGTVDNIQFEPDTNSFTIAGGKDNSAFFGTHFSMSAEEQFNYIQSDDKEVNGYVARMQMNETTGQYEHVFIYNGLLNMMIPSVAIITNDQMIIGSYFDKTITVCPLCEEYQDYQCYTPTNEQSSSSIMQYGLLVSLICLIMMF